MLFVKFLIVNRLPNEIFVRYYSYKKNNLLKLYDIYC